MKKVALALLVVLTISSVSFAEYIPIVREVDNGVADLSTFIIGIHDCGDGISSISDIVCEGNFSQVWGYGGHMPTPTASTLILGGVPTSQWILDTHLLDIAAYSTTGSGVSQEGSALWETIDGITPTVPGESFGDIGMDIMTPFGPSDGSGTGIGTYAIKNPPVGLNDIEFMQVVIPAGEYFTITGKYTNPTLASAGSPMIPFTIITPLPEPSTIVMLVLGTLCLLGIRRRK